MLVQWWVVNAVAIVLKQIWLYIPSSPSTTSTAWEFVFPLNVLGAHLKWIKPLTAVDKFVSSGINWFLSYKYWALVAGTEINFVGMEQFFVPSHKFSKQ